MKKLISLLLAGLMIAATAFILTGCGAESASVSSVLSISSAFRGSRVITVRYPLSADIDSIKDTIIADDPTVDVEGVTFDYKGVEEDGYYFELRFDFNDKADYEREIGAVIGRTATSFLSRKNTVLTKGTRMAENFDAADIIAWMTRVTAAESSTKDIGFTYDVNTVTIDSDTFKTGSTVNISEVEGSTVNSVSVRTSNDKEGSYDRTFVFSVPNQTYVAAKEDFEQYFETNTASAAKYYGWSAEGSNMIYTVIYESLSLRNLTQYTSMLLDTDNVSIYYGDMDNTSTPLSEGLAFEESLDTFSFIGPDRGAPTLIYSYSLPTSTIHGDGAVFEDGQWVNKGSWEEGVYKVELSSGSVQLRIPDGIQYSINGINFYLESLGGERFRRTTSFLYSKTDGHDGMTYAAEFFTKKGAATTTSEDDDNLICSVVTEGTTTEMTAELVKLFGSGNFIAYRKSSGTFALSSKTTFTDYISMSSILNSSNANRPMNYYVSSSGGENIVSVSLDGAETAYVSAEKSVLTLNGGTATVEYRGSIPISSHIILYLLFGLLLLAATIVTVYIMLRRRRPAVKKGVQEIVDAVGADEDDDAPASLAQTTTFSIAELGVLSRNKRYVEEINKDIEKRMEADRLNARKKELRDKELAEMERKVYGTDSESTAEPELDMDYATELLTGAAAAADKDDSLQKAEIPAPDPAADDDGLDMDYATELLNEAASAADRQKADTLPEPDEPGIQADPFDLLDTAGDDDDV